MATKNSTRAKAFADAAEKMDRILLELEKDGPRNACDVLGAFLWMGISGCATQNSNQLIPVLFA